tara:strand:- start:3082 stop:3282 length:201 start_codon:yes stop_codon:yes gene_type:complete
MELVVYGINHNTAPVGIRETIAFNADTLPKALDSLKSELGIVEAVIVQLVIEQSFIATLMVRTQSI